MGTKPDSSDRCRRQAGAGTEKNLKEGFSSQTTTKDSTRHSMLHDSLPRIEEAFWKLAFHSQLFQAFFPSNPCFGIRNCGLAGLGLARPGRGARLSSVSLKFVDLS